VNRATFFDAIRFSFGGSLSQKQVVGMEAILDAAIWGKVTDVQHIAHILAHVRRETGGGMYPIKETVLQSHKDQEPSDAEVIRRLDIAFAKGQLKWVKSPYWRTGMFGRGQIQITHQHNYERLGKAIGVDLVKDVNLALVPQNSARVAIVGMRDGMFTGKKLSDYVFPRAIDLPPKLNPRRIVNGEDGSDKEVAASHRLFALALQKAGAK
jgi:hypothetical protein